MPRVSWDDETAFIQFYQRRVPDGAGGRKTVGYGREFYDSSIHGDNWPEWLLPLEHRYTGFYKYDHRWWRLTQELPIQAADRVLVGGSGFGYLINSARAAGFPNVWGIDRSPWIDSNGPTEAVDETLWVRDDFRGGGAVRSKFRQLTGDDVFDWIITESVLESYEPAPPPTEPQPGPQDPAREMADILAACELSLSGSDLSHCVHLVHQGPNLDPAFTVLSIDEWAAIRPAHSWFGVTNADAWEIRLPGPGF